MKMPVMVLASLALFALALSAAQPAASGRREIQLRLRTWIRPFHSTETWAEVHFDTQIEPANTAIIITDMWDKHWCKGATRRVGLIAGKMEPLLQQVRNAGILIIHAPSETIGFYAQAPGRLIARDAPAVNPPPPLTIADGPLPIDDSDEGCDTPGDKPYKAWSRENVALTIAHGDVISDSGPEIYNVLQQHHIDTILYMGVHANMCILNRPFGVRQMTKWGMRCVLVRDLTDAMYNPASRPFVSHAAGTELVIEHIEKYWAPSTTSEALLAALQGTSH